MMMMPMLFRFNVPIFPSRFARESSEIPFPHAQYPKILPTMLCSLFPVVESVTLGK